MITNKLKTVDWTRDVEVDKLCSWLNGVTNSEPKPEVKAVLKEFRKEIMVWKNENL